MHNVFYEFEYDYKVEAKKKYDSTKEWLQKKYGGREGLFLANRIGSLYRKYEFDCTSNVRVALKGDTKEEAKYKDIKDEGC